MTKEALIQHLQTHILEIEKELSESPDLTAETLRKAYLHGRLDLSQHLISMLNSETTGTSDTFTPWE